MKIKLTDFLAYLECPRKYAHNVLNSQKESTPDWLVKRGKILDIAFAATLPVYVESNAVAYRTATMLKAVLKKAGITKKRWEIPWGKNGKYVIVYDAYTDTDGTPVYIHSSSSEFKQVAKIRTILSLLKKPKMRILTQLTSKLRQKKTESWDAFAKRASMDIQYLYTNVLVSAQEREANKHWMLQAMNKIRGGHVNQYNPTACVHTVEECEYRHQCWDKVECEEVIPAGVIAVEEPDKIIVRERELPFEKVTKKSKK